MSDLRIVKTTKSCRDCDNCRYATSGRYECGLVGTMFDFEGRPNIIPAWCPLPKYPSSLGTTREPKE